VQSTTPLQALTLLNDPSYVEAARVLGAHVIELGGLDFASRLNWLFNQALQRKPQKAESKLLQKLYDDQIALFRANPTEAQKLLGIGLTPVPEDPTIEELVAWASLSRVVLNLHESITRY
jgi:hypothetical protein